MRIYIDKWWVKVDKNGSLWVTVAVFGLTVNK